MEDSEFRRGRVRPSRGRGGREDSFFGGSAKISNGSSSRVLLFDLSRFLSRSRVSCRGREVDGRGATGRDEDGLSGGGGAGRRSFELDLSERFS
jgi:hypothetical protein